MSSCEFHRQTPAQWNCEKCGTYYCKDCIPHIKETEKTYCPICIDTLQINIQNPNKPIWEKLGERIPLSRGKKNNDITPLPNALYKAHILRKNNKNTEAINYLRKHLSLETSIDETHIQVRALYHELLMQEKNIKDLLTHGREYISILIMHGMAKKAFPIFRDCIKTDRSFRLGRAKHTFTLCQAAYNAMDYRLLMAASDGFVNHYPDSPDIVELYLMVAKTLLAEYRKDSQALGLLRFLLNKYPNHLLTPEIEKQMKLADKLESSVVNK